MMKIGKILFGVSALFLANGMMAQSKLDAKQELDVNKQLQYCHKQVGRALEELKQKDGSFDYTMSLAISSRGISRRDGTAERLRPRSGVTASGLASSGWTISSLAITLLERQPKAIRTVFEALPIAHVMITTSVS